MKYGYLRVSTEQQDEENQKSGIMRQSDFYERGTDADKRLNPQVNNNSTVPLSPQEGA